MDSTYETIILNWEPTSASMLLCFVILIGISALTAYFVVTFSTKYLSQDKWLFWLFLFVMQLFIPILGHLIALGLIFLLPQYHKKIYPLDIAIFKNPAYIRKNPVKIQAYSEGWAAIRLELNQFSESERKQALITISRGSRQKVNLIYQQLVSDDMEELRICAFSLLENQQNYLHEKINELIKLYEKTTPKTGEASFNQIQAKAFYAKQLALLYWEFVYLNLGEQEFRKIILGKSQHYAEVARASLGNDPIILVLLARIAIANHEVKKGLDLLEQSIQYGAPANKVYPYLSENRYLHRDFQQVKAYLNEDPTFKYIIKLHPIVKFWCGHG